MNNKTTAIAPLRVSETVEVLRQQIEWLIKRAAASQLYNMPKPAPEKGS